VHGSCKAQVSASVSHTVTMLIFHIAYVNMQYVNMELFVVIVINAIEVLRHFAANLYMKMFYQYFQTALIWTYRISVRQAFIT